MSQFFFQQNLLKSDSSPDTSNSSGSSSSKITMFSRQVRSKRCQLRNANYTSSQRHEWMAVNRSGRVRVVIEIPSVGAKSTQRAAAKNNNLEIVCNVLAAASSQVINSTAFLCSFTTAQERHDNFVEQRLISQGHMTFKGGFGEI
uniref:Uncharacterized protein n=1 Tax=Glossina palpalis gambiensis TaxID=67801 RepID=A0A1B0AP49_9MUSC